MLIVHNAAASSPTDDSSSQHCNNSNAQRPTPTQHTQHACTPANQHQAAATHRLGLRQLLGTLRRHHRLGLRNLLLRRGTRVPNQLGGLRLQPRDLRNKQGGAGAGKGLLEGSGEGLAGMGWLRR